MHTERLLSTLLAALPVSALLAAEYTVGKAGTIDTKEQSTSITISTTKIDISEYPSSVGLPIFWIDASQTNGWTFADAANTLVTTIPSLVGSRYATMDSSEMVNWTGWDNGVSKPQSPVYRHAGEGEFGGMPYLDFGVKGSRRCLLFNAYEYGETGYRTNELRNIGSVVAVFGSQEGGGWGPLGGGPNSFTGGTAGSYRWHRYPTTTESSTWGMWQYCNPVGNVSHWFPSISKGGVRFDGMLTEIACQGHNHAWEILSFPDTLDAGDAVATGIAVGDTRSGHSHASGGQNIAELIIYDHRLSEAELLLVESYLRRKWFSSAPEGYNGNARIGTICVRGVEGPSAGAKLSVDVPADETLALGKVVGGVMPGASFTKKGAGRMELGDISDYTGDLVLDGGTVAVAKRPIPAGISDLAADLFLHFDATDAGSLTIETRDGRQYVKYWNDQAGGKAAGVPICLYQPSGSMQPELLRDKFGDGMHVLDFGTRGSSGRRMYFATNGIDATSPVNVRSMGTVVALLDAYSGGPQALFSNGTFNRGGTDAKAKGVSLLSATKPGRHCADVKGADGTVWVDGVKRDGATEGYASYGFQVVAFRVPLVDSVSYLGYASYGGGFKIGEVLAWNRLLTDREIEDAQAYLMKRWFGREAPGYAKTPSRSEIPDIQSLVVKGDTTLEIPAGTTIRVARARVEANLVKVGGGDLLLENLSCTNGGAIFRDENSDVRMTAGPTVAQSQMAPAPALHLDAADTNHMTFYSADGTNFVVRWPSKDGFNAAYGSNAKSVNPFINPENTIAGVPTVDYGRFNTSSGCRSYLERALYSARTIYAVVKPQPGGFLFGSDSSATFEMSDPANYHFHPVFSDTAITRTFGTYPCTVPITNGKIYTNGVAFANSGVLTPDEPVLLEIHTTGGVNASLICYDRTQDGRRGGYAFAELVVYERPLTAREKISTRNHLMSKWFGAPPAALPEEPELPPVPETSIYVDETLEREFTSDASLWKLFGEGVFTKTGGGTATFADVGTFTGTVNIAAGTLAVAGRDPLVAPKLCSDGLIYWADANRGIAEATTNSSGKILVNQWNSVLGDGWCARNYDDRADYLHAAEAVPGDPDVAYNTTMRLDGSSQAMRFVKDRVITQLDGIKSVLWVIGSQSGGGWLMGGGTHNTSSGNHYPWHRGQVSLGGTTYLQGTTNTCPMLHGSIVCFRELWDAAWYKNGRQFDVRKTTMKNGVPLTENCLSGGWDQLSMVVSNGAASVNAGGFAYDGRGSNFGHQRLGEVLVYNRRLTDTEREETESYLSQKWAVKGTHHVADSVMVHVAQGATLSLGDNEQTFASVTGGGTVAGDLSTVKLVADAAASAVPTVTGTFRIPAGASVELRNIPDAPGSLWIPVVAAAAFNGDMAGVVYAGDELQPPFRAWLRVRDGVLGVRVSGRGTFLSFR